VLVSLFHLGDVYDYTGPSSLCWYNDSMQKIATQVFIYASIAFGIIGILVVLTASGPDKKDSPLSEFLLRLMFITVFIILPSFALSIAGKYLKK
jgi:Na+/H+ antiporter NhaA